MKVCSFRNQVHSHSQLTAILPGAFLPLRLAHLALNCPSLARQSLALAITSATNGKDVQLYTRLHDIASRLGFADLAAVDAEWMARLEEGNKREQIRLEGELKGYKNNMIRESIRMGQEDLAIHFLHSGGPPLDPSNPQSATSAGYNAAYQAFQKMRDYCTTPTHIAGMTVRLLYTSLLLAVSSQQTGGSPIMNFNTAITTANRIRTVGVKEEEMAQLTPIMHAGIGIANLGQGNYLQAATAFLVTPLEYATLGPVHKVDFPRAVASGNDLAVYGGLTALATMSREDLIHKVLGGSFRGFLELEPHMRKAITLYTTAKYQACLATLQHYHSDWALDVFLGPHVDRLLARIREKSITAYFSSFSEVSLAALASTFPPPPSANVSPTEAMEKQCVSLINAGALRARLDVVNGLLIAPRKDARTETLADAKRAADEIERSLLLRLHRVNCVLGGVEVPKSKGGMGGLMQGDGGNTAHWVGGGNRVGNGGY